MKITAIFAFSLAFAASALAQGFNPGGGGSFQYDSIASDTTNAALVYRTDGGLLYRLSGSPTSVSAPAAVATIADGLFAGCTTLVAADLSATAITSLPSDCFVGCTALTTVILPDTCTSIGPNAFAGCTALSSVTAPAIATVAADAFRGCTALAALPAFASGAALGPWSFSQSGLASLDLSSIAPSTGTFAGCTDLASAVNAPEQLPAALFSGCTALDFDPSLCSDIGQAALAGVPYSTIPLASGVALSDYAFAADIATVATLLDTADPTAFDPASPAFLGRTLSYDTGNGIARVEAASLVDWLATEADDDGSTVAQPPSYATADLETWLATPGNADALLDYTGANLAVSGATFLYTPPSSAASALTVSLESTTNLLDSASWTSGTLVLSSTGVDGVETYIPAPAEDDRTGAASSTAFARLAFRPAW